MPLTDREIEDLFDDEETDRVERKASYANPDLVREAICAFSNDMPHHRLPGVVILGQNNDLTCSGLSISDNLMLQLGGLRSEGLILPMPEMQVSRRTIKGCPIATIVVEPSDRPPVRFNGRTCIRVGPRRAVATIDEERRLTERQLWRNLPFDSKPFSGATIADLDVNRFDGEYVSAAFSRRVLDENNRSLEDKLRALRLLSPDGTPTSAALLLLGKDPRSFFPGAYIQFLRIAGGELTDRIVDQREINGIVQNQVKEIEILFRLNNRTGATIGGETRKDISDYPATALEQLIRNSILHRNYDASHTPIKVYWFDDRVEIHNSGGLYGEVTPETIWKGATAYRNPLLAEGMKHLGLVERFGFGLTHAKKSIEKAGLKLRSEFVATYTAFIVERRPC